MSFEQKSAQEEPTAVIDVTGRIPDLIPKYVERRGLRVKYELLGGNNARIIGSQAITRDALIEAITRSGYKVI